MHVFMRVQVAIYILGSACQVVVHGFMLACVCVCVFVYVCARVNVCAVINRNNLVDFRVKLSGSVKKLNWAI